MIVLLTGGGLFLFLFGPPLAKILVLAGCVFVALRRRDDLARLARRDGAGASSMARARRLRTPLVRLATAVGISTEAARLADRCQAGGEGEKMVGGYLGELKRDGWTVLADRKLPRGEANVDFLVISPVGTVFNVDAKLWASKPPLYVNDGRLFHGKRDVTSRLNGLGHETRTVAGLLGVRVISVAAMIGPLRSGELLHVKGVRIVPAEDVCALLRRLDRQTIPQQRPVRLVDTATRLLPSKTGR